MTVATLSTPFPLEGGREPLGEPLRRLGSDAASVIGTRAIPPSPSLPLNRGEGPRSVS
jgi:hypothetical protein